MPINDGELNLKLIGLIREYHQKGLSHIETCERLLGGAVALWVCTAGTAVTAQYLRLFADSVEANDSRVN